MSNKINFPYRIGFGLDVHRLEEGLPFWLGGVQVLHHKGAVGHSDADVLIHAICDAMLGAANLCDIGYHFSDQNPEFKGIDSKILLKKTLFIIREAGYGIANIDSTISLQKPKIAPYITQMKEALSTVLEMDINDLSIKATTTEKLGYEGREEGVTAHAVVMLYRLGDFSR